MRNLRILVFFIALTHNSLYPTPSTPYLPIRSQGVNAVRDLVGWQELINRCSAPYAHCTSTTYGTFATTVEYDQTFWGGRLAQNIFSGDVTATNSAAALFISGSRAENRGPRDWLADYFGLPTDYSSTVIFKPSIKNGIIDFSFYTGLDSLARGLYCSIDVPVVYTRWDLQLCETNIIQGSNSYSPGYFATGSVSNSALFSQATDYFSGLVNHKITNADDSAVDFARLSASLWPSTAQGCSHALTKTAVADVAVTLGYNYWCAEHYYFGANVRVSIPTGNKPCGVYLFEPIAGNGGHLEAGVGLVGHGQFWESKTTGATLGFYYNANITHLCTTRQCRTFDLCSQGTNSRYMLAMHMTPQTNGLQGSPTTTAPTFTASTSEFANAFTPVANLTRQQVKVSANVQADIAIKCTYHQDHWSWDLGYNFWARSHERITLCNKTLAAQQLDGKTWALKGDAQVYGFNSMNAVALAPSESAATIYNGTNMFVSGSDTNVANATALSNPNIDNPQFAFQSGTTLTTSSTSTNVTHTSVQPVCLTLSDLNLAGTKGLSNKVFFDLTYTSKEYDTKLFFVGAGASAEFGNNPCSFDTDRTATPFPSTCGTTSCATTQCVKTCAINQWSVWLKGGLTFDFLHRRSQAEACTSSTTTQTVAVVKEDDKDSTEIPDTSTQAIE